jgi:metal-responsive CopG/Arc/MetJ family transcriptional regulator
MTTQRIPMRKITVSLPDELVEYADRQATRMSTSRSQVIGQALAHIKELEEEELAAEGYQFYADESDEFAAVSSKAVAEAVSSSEGLADAS